MVMNIKVQLEESIKIEETFKNQLEEKEKMKEILEAKIVSLRKELQKKGMQQNNTKILDEIINIQRPYYEKYILG
jgi:predicted acetyltransferase